MFPEGVSIFLTVPATEVNTLIRRCSLHRVIAQLRRSALQQIMEASKTAEVGSTAQVQVLQEGPIRAREACYVAADSDSLRPCPCRLEGRRSRNRDSMGPLVATAGSPGFGTIRGASQSFYPKASPKRRGSMSSGSSHAR